MNSSPVAIAIQLSNIGVSFLRRRSFVQAMATLRDSLKILRACCPSTERTSSVASSSARYELAHRCLQRALARRENAVIDDALDLHVSHVSFDQVECDIDAVNSLLCTPLLEHVWTAVTMGEDQHQMGQEFNTESAIVLHNFALANICVARLRGTDHNLASAVYLWRCATRVMANSIANGQVGSYEEENVTFLWGLLLRNLATTLYIVGEDEESREYAHTLTMVFRPVEGLDLFLATEVVAPAA